MNYQILFFENGVLCTCSINAEDIHEARRLFEMISDCDICHIQNTNEQEWRAEEFIRLFLN
jgi:hypothetical protein